MYMLFANGEKLNTVDVIKPEFKSMIETESALLAEALYYVDKLKSLSDLTADQQADLEMLQAAVARIQATSNQILNAAENQTPSTQVSKEASAYKGDVEMIAEYIKLAKEIAEDHDIEPYCEL